MPRIHTSRRQSRAIGHFVGRTTEQRQFRNTLIQLAGLHARRDEDLTSEELSYPQIFLLTAEGGMGKTTLLRRFETIIAENKERANAKAIYVDCERYAPITDPDHMMHILHDALCAAGFESEMKPYRDAIIKRTEARQKAADAEEKYKSMLATAAGWAVQLASQGMIAKEAAASGVRIGTEATQDVLGFIRKKLSPDEWKLYDDPHALTEAFIEGLTAAATPKRPLVLLLDTYEVADQCDKWLRERTLIQIEEYPRLIIIIAGREGETFIRRYEDVFPPTLIEAIQLDTFARPDIEAYLHQHGITVPTETLIEQLQTLSRGIPLALEGWVNLYQKNIELPPPDPIAPTTRQAIVRRMTDRFLRYCNEDDKHLPAEERKQRETNRNNILTFMLLRRTDFAALSAAWQNNAEEAEHILRSLADQFSFIFAQEIELEPHALVKVFLREHLRNLPVPPVTIQSAVERLVGYFEEQLHKREQICVSTTSVRRPLWGDEQWCHILLDLINALCWLDRSGERCMQLLVPMFVEAWEFNSSQAATLFTTAEDFTGTWHSDFDRFFRTLMSESNPREEIVSSLLLAADRWQLTLLQRAILHLQRGRELLKRGGDTSREKLAIVLSITNEAARLMPEDGGELAESLAYLYRRIGTAYLWPTKRQVGDFYEAVQALTLASRLKSNNQYTWYSLGTASARLQRYEKALRAFQQAIALDPTFASAYNGLGTVYRNLRRYDEALKAFQQAIALDPTNAYSLNGLGNAYTTLQRYDEAIAAYERAIALDPTNAYSLNGLGNVYTTLQRYDEAIAAYERAIALDPTNTYSLNGLGNVYTTLQRYDEALKAFQQAIALDPTNTYSLNSLGEVCNRLRQYDAAIAAYERAIALDPGFAPLYNGLGNVYRNLRCYDEAIAAYERATALDPGFATPHNGLGSVYNKLRQYDKSLSAFQQAITLDPTYATPHNGLGEVYSRLRQYDEAIAAYERAIALDPTNTYSFYGLGEVYSRLRRYDEAITAYEHALVLDPTYATPHNGLGEVYSRLRQYDEALKAFQQAITLDPAYATPHNGLGEVYSRLRQYDATITAYERAIALDPTNTYSFNGLGDVYSRLQRYDEAIAAYKQVIALAPTNAYSYNGLGNVYSRLQRYDEAIAAYKQAIALDPTFVDPHNGLGNVYSVLNRHEEAQTVYTQALVLDPQSYQAMGALARIERQVGNWGRADMLVAHAWSLMPTDDFYKRAYLESIMGNVDGVVDALQVALERKQVTVEWVREDPNFLFIHHDPRYRALVGLDEHN